MTSTSFPRWLARLFSVLFFGQLAVALLFIVLFGALLQFGPFNNEAGTIVFPVEIDATINEANPSAAKAVHDWLDTPQAYEIAAGVPTYLSQMAGNTDRYFLNFSVRGVGDLRQLPLLLLMVGGSGLVALVVILHITYTLFRLFQNLAGRRVFDKQQTRRITRIGQAFLVYAVLNALMRWLAQWGGISYLRANGYVLAEKMTLGIPLPSGTVTMLLTGLCILALAQVFRYGTQLQQDNELTI